MDFAAARSHTQLSVASTIKRQRHHFHGHTDVQHYVDVAVVVVLKRSAGLLRAGVRGKREAAALLTLNSPSSASSMASAATAAAAGALCRASSSLRGSYILLLERSLLIILPGQEKTNLRPGLYMGHAATNTMPPQPRPSPRRRRAAVRNLHSVHQGVS